MILWSISPAMGPTLVAICGINSNEIVYPGGGYLQVMCSSWGGRKPAMGTHGAWRLVCDGTVPLSLRSDHFSSEVGHATYAILLYLPHIKKNCISEPHSPDWSSGPTPTVNRE